MKFRDALSDQQWAALSPAEKMRHRTEASTPSERWLIRELEAIGLEIIPQANVGPYYVDIRVLPRKFGIEVDGPIHNSKDRRKSDRKRQAYIQRQGWTIFRVTNDRLAREMAKVVAEIAALVEYKNAGESRRRKMREAGFIPNH